MQPMAISRIPQARFAVVAVAERVRVLSSLTKVCLDSAVACEQAAEQARDPATRDLLEHVAHQRSITAECLSREIARLDATPPRAGRLSAALSRAWASLSRVFGRPEDHELLTFCEQVEAELEAAFEQALVAPLSPQLEALVAAANRRRAQGHQAIAARCGLAA